MAKQLELELGCNWGGAREGAGRKRADGRPGPAIAHRVRDEHTHRHPVHVTLRARPGLPTFRQEAILRALHHCLGRANARDRHFVHFSLQIDHLHLLLEELSRGSIARTIQGIASSTAPAFNRVLGRSGALWLERCHRHDLCTPTEVHRALGYVLHNYRKHARDERELERRLRGLDPFSSAAWFDGWDQRGLRAAEELRAQLAQRGLVRCTAPAKTFLLAHGYSKLGRIAFDHVPSSALMRKRAS